MIARALQRLGHRQHSARRRFSAAAARVFPNAQRVGTLSSSGAAIEHFDVALTDVLAHKPSAAESVDRALHEDPHFVLGHVLSAMMHAMAPCAGTTDFEKVTTHRRGGAHFVQRRDAIVAAGAGAGAGGGCGRGCRSGRRRQVATEVKQDAEIDDRRGQLRWRGSTVRRSSHRGSACAA